MRALGLVLGLVSIGAQAHIVSFDFVTPSGIGNRTDGGLTAVQWVDGSDPNGLAKLNFYAARNGLAPFAPAAHDAQFGPVQIPVSDPGNVVLWDATAVPPGCYQPFAELTDQIEGLTVRRSSGLITVGPNDGGNLPPAIWILNAPTDAPAANGIFALRLKVDDPDDLGALTVRWSNGEDAGATIVSGLPTPDGGGTLTLSIDPRTLPASSAYYLQAEIKGFDGQTCAVWWSGFLPGHAEVDAGVPDAGAADAGATDAGTVVQPTQIGCACSEAPGGVVLLLLLAVLKKRGQATFPSPLVD